MKAMSVKKMCEKEGTCWSHWLRCRQASCLCRASLVAFSSSDRIPLWRSLSALAPRSSMICSIIISASGWACASQRVMSSCNLTVHSRIKRLQEAWQQWMVHQPLHAGLSVRAGLPCYHLCIENVYLQLKLVALHIQIPQLAAFLQSYEGLAKLLFPYDTFWMLLQPIQSLVFTACQLRTRKLCTG